VVSRATHALVNANLAWSALCSRSAATTKGASANVRAERAVLGGFSRIWPLTSSKVRRIVMRAASRSRSPHLSVSTYGR
jgi:hypothetical protein